MKACIHYRVETDTLKEALATASELHTHTGLKPDSIDLPNGKGAVSFNSWDAIAVHYGDMTEKAYIEKYSL